MELNLVPLLQSTNAQLDVFLKHQGVDRDDFILKTLSSLGGVNVDSSIWNPLLARGNPD